MQCQAACFNGSQMKLSCLLSLLALWNAANSCTAFPLAFFFGAHRKPSHANPIPSMSLPQQKYPNRDNSLEA
jgi:hypothetical protein